MSFQVWHASGASEMNAAEPMVIKATFADWRPVKGRKQLQLIFEVPLEETAVVLKMLGAPMPDKETWCAIALLELNQAISSSTFRAKHPPRAFCDLPMPQQCGIKSNDPAFQKFMVGFESVEDCAASIRQKCGVKSRADILPGTEAGECWLNLLREFEGIR